VFGLIIKNVVGSRLVSAVRWVRREKCGERTFGNAGFFRLFLFTNRLQFIDEVYVYVWYNIGIDIRKELIKMKCAAFQKKQKKGII